MREEEHCPRCRRRIARRDVEYAKFLLLELPCLLPLSAILPPPVGRPFLTLIRHHLAVPFSLTRLGVHQSHPHVYPVSTLSEPPRRAFDSASSSSQSSNGPASRSITNAAKFLIGNGYSLAVQQGARAVACPLDLSGRNARLARPFFHPPVAFREHFSQRCPTLPQHFAQSHSHCGLCNCGHPRFIHAHFPLLNSHPVTYPPPPFSRAISFAYFYLSQTEIEVAHAAAPRIIYCA